MGGHLEAAAASQARDGGRQMMGRRGGKAGGLIPKQSGCTVPGT